MTKEERIAARKKTMAGIFSKTNEILVNNKKQPINWKLCSESLTLF